jgi:hypothetical protein
VNVREHPREPSIDLGSSPQVPMFGVPVRSVRIGTSGTVEGRIVRW